MENLNFATEKLGFSKDDGSMERDSNTSCEKYKKRAPLYESLIKAPVRLTNTIYRTQTTTSK